MRRCITLLTIAAAASLLVLTAAAPVASAADGPRYVVPASSIEHPEDIGVRAHTNIVLILHDDGTISAGAPPVAENPLSLACIYKLVTRTKGCPKTSNVLPTGGTRAIALVDAFDNPDAATDITTFAAGYGYGTPNFTKVKVGSPAPNSGWAVEESLDIEYAFGQAPNAQIYLVEANSNSYSDLLAAEDEATSLLQAAGGGEASNSWGGSESQSETSYDSHFQGQGVVYFASSGDSGGDVIYPSASPYVVSAGGTTILRNPNGSFKEESGWSDAGGGPSAVEPRPAYQNVVKGIVGTQRGTPDFSSEASNVSYVEIYSQYGCGGWCGVGGTSVASPTLAGIINAAGKFSTSTKAELTKVYKDYASATKYKADFTDITAGNNSRYTCVVGYDFCTGIGSPLTFKGK